MNCRLPKVAVLLAVLVLVAGLAFGQPAVKVVTPAGSATITQTGPAPKIPAPFGTGLKQWEGIGSTDYYTIAPYVVSPPNPQVAVGPDDVLTVVNRTIARYPNPTTAGAPLGYGTTPADEPTPIPQGLNGLTPGSGTSRRPPTSQVFLDMWLGITNMNNLCPTVPRTNDTCVIENASVRYDQMQGRFVVLFSVKDTVAGTSNLALLISRWASFNNPALTGTTAYFTTPLPAPSLAALGGCTTQNVGSCGLNWYIYTFNLNVAGKDAQGANVTKRYYPTGARLGIENNNLIMTAPVLDETPSEGFGSISYGSIPGPAQTCTAGTGCLPPPYAGTVVITFQKATAYAVGTAAVGTNYFYLNDNVATGTLTTNPAAFPAITCATGGSPVQTICVSAIRTVFWEPSILRGRPQASYSDGLAYLVGVIRTLVAVSPRARPSL